MWQDYFCVTSVDEVLQILEERGQRARIVAGGTDLLLEIERGVRQNIDTLIDISRIPGLDQIMIDENQVLHLGALVTHNHCAASKLVRDYALPLAQAAWEVGAPQIRNRGTLAGNLITASPANDTITPLMALGAQVTLLSAGGGRTIPLSEFYQGVRKTTMASSEMLVDIAFPGLKENQSGAFIKIGLRRAQAISVVNAAVVISFDSHRVGIDRRKITRASITLGAVAPVIIHAGEAEEFLLDRYLDEQSIEQAASLAVQAARPIDDLRGSAGYRREMVRVGVLHALRSIASGQVSQAIPTQPILLANPRKDRSSPRLPASLHHGRNTPIETRINGQPYAFTTGQEKSLLRLLREDAGLTGTKEGCAEGECGACTVIMDGMAVMSCMVPAPRAHGAEITTIEGIAQGGKLHPLQQAFIDAGAVQCGYCTPGLIMSGVMLLNERSHPNKDEIEQAITGNLCRCTGYYKIVEAIEKAAQA